MTKHSCLFANGFRKVRETIREKPPNLRRTISIIVIRCGLTFSSTIPIKSGHFCLFLGHLPKVNHIPLVLELGLALTSSPPM